MINKIKAAVINLLAPGLYDTPHEEIKFKLINGRAVIDIESLLNSEEIKRQVKAAKSKEQ